MSEYEGKYDMQHPPLAKQPVAVFEQDEIFIYEETAQLGEFAAALALAQLSMTDAVKSSSNPHFRSTYADLASVRDACARPLAENGIGILQVPFTLLKEGKLYAGVKTKFIHKSNQWVSGTLLLPVVDKVSYDKQGGRHVSPPDAQSVSSALTYGRRISLGSMSGVAPSDDDGNAAVAQEYPSEPQAKRPSPVERAKEAVKRVEASRQPSGPPPIDEAYQASMQNLEPPPGVELPSATQPAKASGAPNSDMVTMDFGNQMTKGKLLKDMSINDLESALTWLTTKAPAAVRTKHSRLEAAINHQLKQRSV